MPDPRPDLAALERLAAHLARPVAAHYQGLLDAGVAPAVAVQLAAAFQKQLLDDIITLTQHG